LYHYTEPQKPTDNLPALVSLLLATEDNNGECDKGCELENDSKIHEEADATPLGAKLTVDAEAVLVGREGCAGVRE